MGFPNRSDRDAIGPTLENERPVKNPKREIGSDAFNLAFWQISGVSQTVPRISIRGNVSGSSVTVDVQGVAWDPNGTLPAITVGYKDIGWYNFAFSSQYPDEKGVNQSLTLIGGNVSVVNGTTYTGSHTGADNQAILTDATKTWTPSELVGQFVINTTDESGGEIVANTGTTVTATLAGGWDNGDAYIIINRDIKGYLHLTSSIGGYIFFIDNNGCSWDPEQFIMQVW